MRNPYEILGVREGASIDEIKKAYRELVKKYHPDQYSNNPLSDLAEEKLKEINQAYDYLVKQHESGSGHGYSQKYDARQTDSSNYGYDDGDRSYYNQARNNINMGNFAAAEDLLSRVGNRNAEWFYLTGLVYMKKGWYNEAYTNISRAVNMDPGNYEYREALNRINYNNRQYQSNVFGRRGYGNSPDICTICECLYCSDCCCECAGGDLINCC